MWGLHHARSNVFLVETIQVLSLATTILVDLFVI